MGVLVYQPMKSSESANRPSPDKKSLKHLSTFRGHSSLKHKYHSGFEKLPGMISRCMPIWATATEHSVTAIAELLDEFAYKAELAGLNTMAGWHPEQSVQLVAGVRQNVRAADRRLDSASPSSVALQTNWGMTMKASRSTAKRMLTKKSQRRKL